MKYKVTYHETSRVTEEIEASSAEEAKRKMQEFVEADCFPISGYYTHERGEIEVEPKVEPIKEA